MLLTTLPIAMICRQTFTAVMQIRAHYELNILAQCCEPIHGVVHAWGPICALLRKILMNVWNADLINKAFRPWAMKKLYLHGRSLFC